MRACYIFRSVYGADPPIELLKRLIGVEREIQSVKVESGAQHNSFMPHESDRNSHKVPKHIHASICGA